MPFDDGRLFGSPHQPTSQPAHDSLNVYLASELCSGRHIVVPGERIFCSYFKSRCNLFSGFVMELIISENQLRGFCTFTIDIIFGSALVGYCVLYGSEINKNM